MRFTEGVEFRTKSEAPVKPGFFYGRVDAIDGIVPLEVYLTKTFPSGEDKLVFIYPDEPPISVEGAHWVDWFGPVREVRESGT